MHKNFKFDIFYYWSAINPIILLSIGIIISHILFGTGIIGEETNQETNSVFTFNFQLIIYLIIYLLIGAIVFYIIFTRLRHIKIRLIYAGVFTMTSFYLFGEIVNELLVEKEISLQRKIILIILFLSSILFFIRFIYIYGTGRVLLKTRNLGIILSSIITGRVITLYFDLTTIIYFSIIIALFDIWNVFRGPLSKIIGKPKFSNESFELKDPRIEIKQIQKICLNGTPVLISTNRGIMIGIGDLFFYSLLLYRSFIEWGLIGHILIIFALILGHASTLKLLKWLNPLPGLPFPILFSLIGFFLLSIFF